jgi:hypothetical protein
MLFVLGAGRRPAAIAMSWPALPFCRQAVERVAV